MWRVKEIRKFLMTVVVILCCLTVASVRADWQEQQKLIAGDADQYDYFGYSVSIDGDYAIIGACYDDEKTSNAGAAYIFKHEGIYWNPQPPKLTASDASAGDNFGCSVAIDCNYAIVGATGDDIDAVNGQTGCAYIFKCTGSPLWTEQDILFASDPCMSDYFSKSVSISGDYALV